MFSCCEVVYEDPESVSATEVPVDRGCGAEEDDGSFGVDSDPLDSFNLDPSCLKPADHHRPQVPEREFQRVALDVALGLAGGDGVADLVDQPSRTAGSAVRRRAFGRDCFAAAVDHFAALRHENNRKSQ